MTLQNLVVLLAVFCPFVSGSQCGKGMQCPISDETALVQVKHVVKSAGKRAEEEVENADENLQEGASHFIFERRRRSTPVTLPTGCRKPVCIGTAPVCGGEPEDCTFKGLTHVGWTRRCPGSFAVCISGWKVYCASGCPAGTKGPPKPTIKKLIIRWVAPVFRRRRTQPPPEVKPIVLPKWNGIGSYSFQFNRSAVGAAALALKEAIANIGKYKADVCNITKEIEGLEKNITLFTDRERIARADAVKARDAAVKFAKKRALANITVMKADKAMDDAYMAQEGAINRAERTAEMRQSMKNEKVWYKKDLLEKEELLKKAQAALRVWKISVNRAMGGMKQAKMETYHDKVEKSTRGKREKVIADEQQKRGEEYAMKKAMEHAYADASPKFGVAGDHERNRSNVPTWGTGSGVAFTVAAPPCHCVGFPGCACSKWKWAAYEMGKEEESESKTAGKSDAALK